VLDLLSVASNRCCRFTFFSSNFFIDVFCVQFQCYDLFDFHILIYSEVYSDHRAETFILLARLTYAFTGLGINA
jgi:hypothetical protein